MLFLANGKDMSYVRYIFRATFRRIDLKARRLVDPGSRFQFSERHVFDSQDLDLTTGEARSRRRNSLANAIVEHVTTSPQRTLLLDDGM